jgi:opacity protein-like surface antigen
MSTNFTFAQSRDSVSAKRRFGEEVGRNQSLSASLSKDLKIISPRLTYNATYNEDHRFEIRQDQNLRNVSNSGRYGISGSVNIKDIVKFFTRLRDETQDSLLSVGSPAWIAKQVETFIGFMQNPQLSYTRQRSSSYLNVKARPSVEYQLGLVDSIPAEDVAPGSYPGRGMIDSYTATSGLTFKIISLQAGYNGQITRTFNYDFEARNDNTSYPNINVRLSRVEQLPFLKKYMRSSSINAGFNQTYESRYEIRADSSYRTSDSKTLNLNPLISWQSNWVKGISTTIGINYSETRSNNYAGATIVESRSLNRGVSGSVSYTFSAPRGISLPFLSGIKFASNLSMNLSVNYNRSTNYFSDLSDPRNDSSTLSTSLGLSYNFSSSITGGANFDYSQNKEINSSQDSRRVGLNIWTNINF